MITTQTISKIVKVLCYIHATLFLIMITPLLYGIGEVELENSTIVLTIKCLLILIPVIITEKAEKTSKNLAIYLLICIGTTALVFVVTYFPFRPLSVYGFCYTVTLVAETILLTITRLIDRLKKADYIEPKEPSIFDKPKVVYVWYFIVMYVIGLLFNAKMLSDVSFWTAIIYMLIAFCYEYLTSTKDYLNLHSRTKGIPRKRLYGISTAMVLMFLVICLIGILPSMFMSGYRKYTDIRHWFDDVAPVEYEYESDGDFNPQIQQENPMMAFLEEDGEVNEPSKLANAIFWAVGALCFIGLIYGFIQIIRQIFKDFRNTLDENGDIIEEIKDDEISYKEDELYIKGNHIDTEAMKIRRRYKKAIKRHRKDIPAPYESPNEIEENAGLINNEEMQLLHGQYENARYGNLGRSDWKG
jgi:hypothetical protein